MKIKRIIIGCMLIGIVIMLPGYNQIRDAASKNYNKRIIVIDAGHGGPDSGAVAGDGTEEKTLNLEIAEAVKREARKKGISVIMTRSDDKGLYSKESNGIKWSKCDDIQRRKEIIDKSGAKLALTIHMNIFKADTNVHGAQVFFPGTGEEQQRLKSKEIGENLQETLINGLPELGKRVAMEKNDIYLFRNITVPTILVECGFLSNKKDLKNLRSAEFQRKLAVYIIKSINKNC